MEAGKRVCKTEGCAEVLCSVVDPGPVGSETLLCAGRLRIRDYCTGSESDLFNSTVSQIFLQMAKLSLITSKNLNNVLKVLQSSHSVQLKLTII
jgi:hypothetical protein